MRIAVVALPILSLQGQAILARYAFKAVGLPQGR
jgi:hypothetical protein